jgi:hypothetical protein
LLAGACGFYLSLLKMGFHVKILCSPLCFLFDLCYLPIAFITLLALASLLPLGSPRNLHGDPLNPLPTESCRLGEALLLACHGRIRREIDPVLKFPTVAGKRKLFPAPALLSILASLPHLSPAPHPTFRKINVAAMMFKKQDVMIGLLKINVAAIKRKEDLAFLTADMSLMCAEVKGVAQGACDLVLAEIRSPPTSSTSSNPKPVADPPEASIGEEEEEGEEVFVSAL